MVQASNSQVLPRSGAIGVCVCARGACVNVSM